MKKNLSLALAMIVADEPFELERCMKSVQGLFDEIVIVVTVKEGKVYDVAKKYADTVEYFEWIWDFAAARNFSFSLVKSSHIFWLDADDIITSENKKKIAALKNVMKDYDAILLQWNYSHDAMGRPESVLHRERILKKEVAKWEGAVHECIPLGGLKTQRYFDIFVDHFRTKPCDITRNLDILKKVYETKPTSRMTFYYARDLYESGYRDEAIPVFEKFVSQVGEINEMIQSCIKLSQYFFEKKNLELARKYATLGLSFSNEYAELFVAMGNIAWQENNLDLAIDYYRQALSKKFTADLTQLVSDYTLTPASNLSVLYDRKGDVHNSLRYNRLALKYSPNNPGLLNDRKWLLSRVNKIRVAWLVPYLDLTFPSTRIRYYNIHEKLKEYGIESEIISDYYTNKINVSSLDSYDVIIFTQYSSDDYEFMKVLKKRGKKVVFDHCEAMFNEAKRKCMNEAHAIVCCSTKLSELTKKLGFENFGTEVLVIKDAIEPRIVSHTYEQKQTKLKALFMGMGGGSTLVTQDLKETIEKAGYELELITEWDDATKKWDLKTWHEDMSSCDVVLCPQKVDVHPAKSNVKVTTAMALGMPVIASPLQSYCEAISHKLNGYICDSNEEWLNALIELKDENKRKQIGMRAKDAVGLYSLDMITCSWIDLLYDLIIKNRGTEKVIDSNSVDVIVVSYNNLEYLKLCIDSIRKFTKNYRLIISDSGSEEETWQYLRSLESVTLYGSKEKRLNYSQACNVAIAHSTSKYFVILNSDVIVSDGWLDNLVEKMNKVPRLAVCGVLSNCDRGWLHNLPLKLEKSNVDLVPGMKYQQIEPNLQELYAFMSRSNIEKRNQFVEQKWVAVYATIFARSAINEVGFFDTSFQNGCEDLDLCTRLKKYEYTIGQSLDSFVFHFGGISRGAYELENKVKYQEEDRKNHEIYHKKYERERVIIYTGPAWERWNKQTVLAGMAGSETWAVDLAEQLYKKGYSVTVYNDLDVDERTDENIRYRHYSKLLEDLQFIYVDYFIASRTCDVFQWNLHTHKRYTMIHDIWISSDTNYNVYQNQVTKYAVLSEWHRDFVSQHHRIPKEKMFLTANGVDISRYKAKIEKKNKIFYSSSLDRGLRELLRVFPRIRQMVPDLELVVAYGVGNWEKAMMTRNNPDEKAHFDEVQRLLKQPGVQYLGRVSKSELAKHQLESKAWLYPTWFQETFCITAVESGLADCAILSSRLAGLITTVDDAGILLNGSSYSNEYLNAFVENSIKLLTDENFRQEWAKKAHERMLRYSWEKVADTWISEFKGLTIIGEHTFSSRELALPSGSKKKLNLGCGNKRIEGYVGVDLFKGPAVDETFSIIKIPYADCSIGGIYSEHALEHLTFTDVEKALREWHRVLDRNAELILKIPDLELCCSNYLLATNDQTVNGFEAKKWFRYTLFGIQKSQAGEPDEAQIHKSGFSKQEIRILLESVGFQVLSVANYNGWGTPSIEIHAKKPAA